MTIKSKPVISLNINGEIYDNKLFESLKSLSKTYSQRKSAKELKISHAVLNRRIKKAEKKLGFKLVKIVGSGSELTDDGYNLLYEFYNYENQLKETYKINICGGHIISGLLESITENTNFNIDIYSSNDNNAYKLAKRGVIDILALDDPLIAFEKDLNFKPIAYDYLVLISSKKSEKINNLNDLRDLKFVSVKGSAQRLAWNTLKQANIPFKIEKQVNSQFDAFKIVKNSEDLYSFLNASYFNGNKILKYETKHVISLVQVNSDKKNVKEFMEYIQNEGQKSISKEGFTPIKTIRQ